MDSDQLDHIDYVRHVLSCHVTFARSATRHRIGKARMLEALRKPRAAIRMRAPSPAHEDRVLVLGDDAAGRALEVVVVLVQPGAILAIHAMELRSK
jgi:hypothetical protein